VFFIVRLEAMFIALTPWQRCLVGLTYICVVVCIFVYIYCVVVFVMLTLKVLTMHDINITSFKALVE